MQLAHLTVLLALIASAALLLWWSPWDAPAPLEPCVGVAEIDGDVRWPGVLCLSPGGTSRGQALALAGARADCVETYLDASRRLQAGQRLEVLHRQVTSSECAVRVGALSGAAAVASGTPLDLNLASTDDLAALPGIGPVTAVRIVTERSENGSFASLDDLRRVRGVGPKTIERLRGLATATPSSKSEE